LSELLCAGHTYMSSSYRSSRLGPLRHA